MTEADLIRRKVVQIHELLDYVNTTSTRQRLIRGLLDGIENDASALERKAYLVIRLPWRKRAPEAPQEPRSAA